MNVKKNILIIGIIFVAAVFLTVSSYLIPRDTLVSFAPEPIALYVHANGKKAVHLLSFFNTDLAKKIHPDETALGEWGASVAWKWPFVPKKSERVALEQAGAIPIDERRFILRSSGHNEPVYPNTVSNKILNALKKARETAQIQFYISSETQLSSVINSPIFSNLSSIPLTESNVGSISIQSDEIIIQIESIDRESINPHTNVSMLLPHLLVMYGSLDPSPSFKKASNDLLSKIPRPNSLSLNIKPGSTYTSFAFHAPSTNAESLGVIITDFTTLVHPDRVLVREPDGSTTLELHRADSKKYKFTSDKDNLFLRALFGEKRNLFIKEGVSGVFIGSDKETILLAEHAEKHIPTGCKQQKTDSIRLLFSMEDLLSVFIPNKPEFMKNIKLSTMVVYNSVDNRVFVCAF